MRILADENISGHIVSRLRGVGHDLRWAKEMNLNKAEPNV